MNTRFIGKLTGLIFLIESAFMLFPMAIALAAGEDDWKYFLITAGCGLILGLLLFRIKTKNRSFYAKDGFVSVGIAWVVMSIMGAVPYYISGFIPDFVNAIFESVSGFTTSGISVVADIEIASRSMLFWRSLTHWIGGMGVLVFMLALSNIAGGSSMYLMRAEAPGPTTEKIRPKISQTAKWLYAMYFVLTGMEIIALKIAGLSVFNASLISFGTMATGGFSYLNTSLATFTAAQQIIVTVFMVLAGVNFTMYFLAVTGKIKRVIKDSELRWYLAITLLAALLIFANVSISGTGFDTSAETFRHSAFAAVSALTSTGFNTMDYNIWPSFTKILIITLMFIGGCAGSTAGGIKVSRIVLMVKTLKRNIKEAISPKGVYTVKYNRKPVPDSVVKTSTVYFALIMTIFIISVLIVSFESGMDITTAFASVATTLHNNGIEIKGNPDLSFASYEWYTRLVYIINMLIGRLEIMPVVVLFSYLFKPAEALKKEIKRRF